MPFSSIADFIWVKTNEMAKKLIWCLRLNVEFFEHVGGEIFDVVRDDYVGVASNRSGKYMPIVRIGQIDCGNQLLVPSDQGIGCVSIHEISCASQFDSAQVWSVFQ